MSNSEDNVQVNSSAALASLTATYTDSELSDEEESQGTPQLNTVLPTVSPAGSSRSSAEQSKDKNNQDSNLGPRHPVSKLVSYVGDLDRDDEDEDEFNDNEHMDGNIVISSRISQNRADTESASSALPFSSMDLLMDEGTKDSIRSYTSSLNKNMTDDVKLPPEPPGRCSNQLQEKIAKYYEKKLRDGLDMNASILKKKELRNPSIYEKLIAFCGIDELGTNYPPQIFDPKSWGKESFYEELAKAQKVEMDKRQKERTKVEFVSGTAKKTSTNETQSDDGKKRKSKWDVGASQSVPVPPVIKPVVNQAPGIVPINTAASGTKATVISAFGTISKKAKQ